jgi:hypothetical protein
MKPHNARKQIRAKRHWSKNLFLHPTSIFTALIIGVLLTGLTVKVIGDTITVSARIPAPPLTTPATIDNPSDGQEFTSSPITVSGTCPDDSYVKLYRNGMFSGVAVCVNQTYSIQTDLFVGTNTLLVQDYNITDDPGPTTPTINVIYNPPVGSDDEDNSGTTGGQYIPPSSNDTSDSSNGGPLLLWSDYRFAVVTTDDTFTWKLRFQFGMPPFVTHVDWGDNSMSDLSVLDHNQFTIKHHYDQTGYYTILVTGRDAKGREAHLQLAALIKKPGALGTINSILSGGNSSQSGGANSFRWLLVAWPAYAVIALMIVSFWLGERREFLQLIGRYQHRHRRHA